MAKKTCTVIIKNSSSDLNRPHKYFVYFIDQSVVCLVNNKVTGGELTTRQPIFFRTGELTARNSQTQFRVTSQLYAIIAERGQYNSSRPLQNNEEIIIKQVHDQPIDVGRNGDSGSSLVIRWDGNDPFFIEKDSKNSDIGTFSIACSASVPSDNKYVVGLARYINGENLRPVAVVRCMPDTKYRFTPREEIYVERCTLGNHDSIVNGMIVPAVNQALSLRVRFWLRFDSDEADIIITEKSNGFHMNGQLTGDAASAAPEDVDNKEIPACRRPQNFHPGMAYSASSPSNAGSGKHSKESDTACPPSSNPTPSKPSSSFSDSTTAGQKFQPSQFSRPSQPSEPPQSSQAAVPPAEAHPSGETREDKSGADDDQSDNESEKESPTSFSRLYNYHTVFVVDDTGSMLLPANGDFTGVRQIPRVKNGPTRWDMVLEALQHIANVAVHYGGIDIHFLVHSWCDRRDIKESKKVGDLLKDIASRREFWRGGGPTQFKPSLASILDSHVRKLRKSREPGTNVDGPKPLDLIVLTDGVAKDKKSTEALIVKTAQDLSAMDEVRSDQVRIQFVQVGEDKDAAKFLTELEKNINAKLEDKRDVSS
jgi:hypothetical protein